MAEEFDIVYGKTGDCSLENQLANAIKAIDPYGTIYIGYPIIVSGDSYLQIDVLYSSSRYGLIVFDLKHFELIIENEKDNISDYQTELFSALSARMMERSELRNQRSLKFPPKIISLHHSVSIELPDGTIISTIESLTERFGQEKNLSIETCKHLNGFIQRSNSLKPKKNRERVKLSSSLGAKLQIIENQITNLDRIQTKAAINSFRGVQRIRGLEGTGKTIVLAQKAALLHVNHPQWRILITFFTHSLYQRFKSLVRRFVFDHIRQEPDFEKLKIMHGWGGYDIPGVYSEICWESNFKPLSFSEARSKFGQNQAFHGSCQELLNHIHTVHPLSIYDSVLIDEAQDFPQPFFELIYLTTQEPKRIVYAYDELQSLTDIEMSTPGKLFGKDKKGLPRVKLQNLRNTAKQDIVLPVCYRNPPWILSSAHSLGFGIYRDEGLVQMFKDTKLWNDIGYEEKNSEIVSGSNVSLKRKDNSSPSFFQELIDKEESLKFKVFKSKLEECRWVHEQVLLNIQEEEIDLDDILIVVADSLSIRSVYAQLVKLFLKNNIDLHLPGLNSNSSEIFIANSIAVTTVSKAKRNEAPIVYVIGADYCYEGKDIVTRRNALFTALTRARAWVRVSGTGNKMTKLIQEFTKVKNNNFELNFMYPTNVELQKIRTLSEKATGISTVLNEVLSDLVRGKITAAQIPPQVKNDIIALTEDKVSL